ncbi:MAG: hypothetical protein JOZ05_07210 [Acetobacteraceae bacterium]|nr:hypothetical protein [Acetobacteraceae bacterium]
MPDGSNLKLAFDQAETGFTRHDRPTALAFVSSSHAETALRDGLSEWLPDMEVRRGGIRAAITSQRSAVSPRVLIVDVTGLDPLPALGELSAVVEPETCVLVIGEANDLALYREITRGLGAAEYVPGPLTRDLVRQHFASFVRGQAPEPERGGGRLVTVTGARGGVGASVVAIGLARHLGDTRRHTLLLDADLVRGTSALMLDTEAGDGLRTALVAPERIDALLAERAARRVADRVHVLSAGEDLADTVERAPEACSSLLEALRRRYNAIVADAPWNADPFCRELLASAHHRIVVMTPTLPSVREALRLIGRPGRDGKTTPTTLVLNRANMAGGLKRAQIESALRAPVDAIIPDLPREISDAITLGAPAKASSFTSGIAAVAGQISAFRAGSVDHAASSRRRWRLFR